MKARKKKRRGWTQKRINAVLRTMKKGASGCPCFFCFTAAHLGSAAIENSKGETIALAAFRIVPFQ